MTDDPDDLRYEIKAEKKDPTRQIAAMRAAIDNIELNLRYGLPHIKFIGWVVVILLGFILWRLWVPNGEG